MDRPILRLGPIISGSFSALFSQLPLYLVPVAILFVIPVLVQLLVGFWTGIVVATLTTTLALTLITAIALAQHAGREDLAAAAQENLASRSIHILIITLISYAAYGIVIYLLFRALFPTISPELEEFGQIYWRLVQTGGADEEALAAYINSLVDQDPEILLSWMGKFALIGGFCLLIFLASAAFFLPVTSLVVHRDMGQRAWARSISLSSGYHLKLVGGLSLLILIYFGLATGISMALAIPNILLGPGNPIVLIMTQILASAAFTWFIIALVRTYLSLTDIKEDLDEKIGRVFG